MKQKPLTNRPAISRQNESSSQKQFDTLFHQYVNKIYQNTLSTSTDLSSSDLRNLFAKAFDTLTIP